MPRDNEVRKRGKYDVKQERNHESKCDGIKKQKIKKQSEKGFSRIFLIIIAFLSSLIISLTLTEFVVYSRIDAQSFDLGDPMEFVGALSKNNRLENATLFLQEQIFGPESIAVHPKTGLVYSGLKTGLLCEIDLSVPKIVKAVMLAKKSKDDICHGNYQSQRDCGRPLGLRFNEAGELLVIDAYSGLFAVNWKTEETIKVISAGAIPDDDDTAPPVRYLNDFDFLPDGRLVISESSTKFDDRDMMYDLFEHKPNGRLLLYDPKKKTLRILKDGLYFPNGVQYVPEKMASKDDPFRVFYSEMGMTRIMSIWIPRDPYTNKPIRTRVLIPNLPGYPDNIRLSKSGHLLVPISSIRTKEDRFLETWPLLRDYLTKILAPQTFTWVAEYISQSHGLVLKVNVETGQVVESYHDQTGKISSISIAIEDNEGRLLIGSDAQYYIARVDVEH